jgi:1,2-diacylglycerol 3-alpha-glucosyltransferase
MYKPHISGVTNCIDLLKKQFESLGHEVWVFTFGNLDYEDTEPNVVRSPALAWGDTGWQAGLRLSGEAREIIPTLDIAHVHHPFLSGRVALKQCKPHGIPVVSTNHTRYDLYSDSYAAYVPRSIRMGFLPPSMYRGYLRGYAEKAGPAIFRVSPQS